MLGARGYKAKKDIKLAIGQPLRYVETSMFCLEFKPDGVNYVVGPCAYTARKWYAAVTCAGGLIKAVK